MGQYFLVVNPSKRQYLDADRFGENVKNNGELFGWHAVALGLLIRNALRKPSETHPLIGAWAGDPVITCGDYAPEFPVPQATISRSREYHTLYELAEHEFTDISDDALVMLCSGEFAWYANETARALVQAAGKDTDLLIVLGDITLHREFELLHRVLFEELGDTWYTRYQAACRGGFVKRFYGRLERDETIRHRLVAKEREWHHEDDG